MEDIVQQMKNDISYGVLKGDVFQCGLHRIQPAHGPEGRRDAGRLLRQRQPDRPEPTSRRARASSSKRRLKMHVGGWSIKEKELQDYRTRFSGQLPTQLESNLQAQVNVQGQIRELSDAINQAQTRRLLLESQAKDLEGQAPGAEGPGFVADDVRGGRHGAGRDAHAAVGVRQGPARFPPEALHRRAAGCAAHEEHRGGSPGQGRRRGVDAPRVSRGHAGGLVGGARATEEAQGDAGSDCSTR